MDKMCRLAFYILYLSKVWVGEAEVLHTAQMRFRSLTAPSRCLKLQLLPWDRGACKAWSSLTARGCFGNLEDRSCRDAKMTRCDKTFDFVQQECSAGPFFGRLSSLSCDRVLGWISQWKCVVTMGFQSPTCSRAQDSIEEYRRRRPQPPTTTTFPPSSLESQIEPWTIKASSPNCLEVIFLGPPKSKVQSQTRKQTSNLLVWILDFGLWICWTDLDAA